ncbi:coiled-coil domain-containing protein [Cesiribacter andamanensis]|uniref:Uncharacterized protein n=1 Tax=Cesiribacter andamanensis AMV16 TaxID=1279009 RepID=M7N506_9BACT|nr:hypothetical protein [Cesiribacter andamanensis]EMR02382.1 hypothetical protein ADICEAN_02478 [Cesiribacter andamanensis AMV16]
MPTTHYRPARIFLGLLLILWCIPLARSQAQTAGSGTLSSIESKARLILQNDEKVGKLNSQHLQTYSEEQQKLETLKKELTALYIEKKEVMDELRRGRFCNGCSRTASELRKSGVSDVERHFADNGGTHSASPELLKQKEAEYDRKIADKENQIRAFEFSENEFTRKRADLDKQMQALKDNSDKLREEIIELSKTYKSQVVAESKSMTRSWISDLMYVTAQKHAFEDRIDIIMVKLADLQQEENGALIQSDEKVREQNDREIDQLRREISNLQTNRSSLQSTYRERHSQQSGQLSSLRTRLQRLKSDALKPNLSQQEQERLAGEIETVERSIDSQQSELNQLTATYQERDGTLEAGIKKHNDEIWQLTTNLSSRQQQARELIKKAYATKRRILEDARVARMASLQTTGTLLGQKMTDYRKRFGEYAAKVEAERIRLFTACQQAGCSCYGNDTHSTIYTNWNNSLSCVNQMEQKKQLDVYYGCEEEAPLYSQHYQSQMSGLSDSDMSALQRRTSQTKYDLILKKVQ